MGRRAEGEELAWEDLPAVEVVENRGALGGGDSLKSNQSFQKRGWIVDETDWGGSARVLCFKCWE